MVVRGLHGAAAAPELFQAEGTEVLLRVRIPALAHFFRYLKDEKDKSSSCSSLHKSQS